MSWHIIVVNDPCAVFALLLISTLKLAAACRNSYLLFQTSFTSAVHNLCVCVQEQSKGSLFKLAVFSLSQRESIALAGYVE